MKFGTIILGASMLLASTSFGQDEAQKDENRECDRMRKIANDAMEAKNYKEAVTYFLRGEVICGGYDATNYGRLTGCIMRQMKVKEDKDLKKTYGDTLQAVWERMDENGIYDVKKDMVRGYYSLQHNKASYSQADFYFSRGMEAQGTSVKEMFVPVYYNNTYNMYAVEKDEAKKSELKKRLIKDFFSLSALVTEAKMGVKTQEKLMSFFNKVVQNCDDLTPEIGGFISTLPAEPEAAKKALRSLIALMEDKKCTDSQEYMDLINKFLEIDPESIEALEMKAKVLEKQKKYREANVIYKKLMALEEVSQERKDELHYKTTFNLYKMGSYTAAYNSGKAGRGAFKGKCLEIAGKAVGANVNNCGTSTFERKCNYIYAVQLLKQSGVSNDGTIAKFTAEFPSSDLCFENNSPASVTLECYGVSVSPCK